MCTERHNGRPWAYRQSSTDTDCYARELREDFELWRGEFEMRVGTVEQRLAEQDQGREAPDA